MKCRRKDRSLLFLVRNDGIVAAEFCLLLPLFLLVVAGIVELGHMWYVDHVITNASREGARAAVVYQTNYAPFSDRSSWATDKAKTTITTYLSPGGKSMLPGVTINVTPTATGNNTGNSITVKVTASNLTVVLADLVSTFKGITLTATTTMRME